jgi:RNA polymerase sigma factor (sigma-70 family)
LRPDLTVPDTAPQVAALLEAATNGDERAWSELVAQFHGLLWATARACGLSEADAADVTQTTWLRLAEHLGRITEPEALPGWLVTTTRREAIRVSNRARRPLPAVLFGAVDLDADQSAVDLLVRAERHQELRVAFRHLGERCRLLLAMLSADARYSYEEISSHAGIPVGSIGPTRRRCLTKLVALLGDDDVTGTGTVSVVDRHGGDPARRRGGGPPAGRAR